MPKPKLLIALSRFPYPAVDGTRYKILTNVSDALKQDFDLEYFVVTFEKPTHEAVAHIEAEYGPVYVFQISKGQFMLNSLRSVWNGKPFQTSGYYSRKAAHWLAEHVGQYAAAYAHTIRMANYFESIPEDMRQHVLMEFNDAISLNYNEAKRHAAFPLSAAYALEEKRIKKYETKLLRTFSHANVVSLYDREYLLGQLLQAERTAVDLVSIPHGVSVPTRGKHVQKHQAYFIGQLGYEMNKDAVLCLLRDIWPKVRERISDAELMIIGKGDQSPFAAYAHMPGVQFLGFVEDPSLVIQSSACLVAPLRSGAGMPSKIIEALGYGVPVLTTPLGARGIAGATDEKNMRIISIEETDAWVDALVECMTKPEYRTTLGEAGHSLFMETYSLARVQAAWRELFARIKR